MVTYEGNCAKCGKASDDLFLFKGKEMCWDCIIEGRRPLESLTAQEIKDLIRLGHPYEKGEPYARTETMTEIERRGESLLKELGWPTDTTAMYRNIYTGSEETLGSLLQGIVVKYGGEEPEYKKGRPWYELFGVVEHWDPAIGPNILRAKYLAEKKGARALEEFVEKPPTEKPITEKPTKTFVLEKDGEIRTIKDYEINLMQELMRQGFRVKEEEKPPEPTAIVQGDYVLWGARVMVFDGMRDGKPFLEDPFGPPSKYGFDITQEDFNKLKRPTKQNVISEYERLEAEKPSDFERRLARLPEVTEEVEEAEVEEEEGKCPICGQAMRRDEVKKRWVCDKDEVDFPLRVRYYKDEWDVANVEWSTIRPDQLLYRLRRDAREMLVGREECEEIG